MRSRIKRPPAVVFDDSSLREAADHMARERVGRLPVVSRDDPARVIGMLTRADIIESHVRRLQDERVAEATVGTRFRRANVDRRAG